MSIFLAIVLLLIGAALAIVALAATPIHGGRRQKRANLIYPGIALVLIAIGWLLWDGYRGVLYLVGMASH